MAAKNTTKRSGATRTKSSTTKPKAETQVAPPVAPAETAPETAPVATAPAETRDEPQTDQNEAQGATIALILMEDIEIEGANGETLSIPAESVAIDTGERNGPFWRVTLLDHEEIGPVGVLGSLLFPAPEKWKVECPCEGDQCNNEACQCHSHAAAQDAPAVISEIAEIPIWPTSDVYEMLDSFSAFGAAFILARMMKMRGKPGHRDAQTTLVDPDNSERWSASLCPETNDLLIEHEPNAYGELQATAAVDKASRDLAVALRDRSAIQAVIDSEEDQYAQELALANRVGSEAPDEAEFSRKVTACKRDIAAVDQKIAELRNTLESAKRELAAHVRRHYRFPDGEYQVVFLRAIS